jgi:hypothetical protein
VDSIDGAYGVVLFYNRRVSDHIRVFVACQEICVTSYRMHDDFTQDVLSQLTTSQVQVVSHGSTFRNRRLRA